MKRIARGFRLSAALVAGAACLAAGPVAAQTPTVEEAKKFIAEANQRLLDLTIEAGRAQWVQANFITYDTEILAAKRNEVLTAAGVELAKEATRFDKVELPADLRRQMDLLKRSLTLPAPSDPKKTAELTRLAAGLEGMYGSGKYCRKDGNCLDLEQLSDIIEQSRDPKELLEAWTGWHSIAPPMRDDYQRLVELANEGARELGYKDTGALWRSKYDMPPDAFAAEVDRLWNQVKPLYDSLHCYVRAGLNKKYGDQVVPPNGPIPAHVLGNMWSQQWDSLYDVLAAPGMDTGTNLTPLLQAKKVDAKEMVRYGERFFTSLGFAPLPETFWERSLFTKPQDREVVCHASAWDMDYKEDLRIKMCIQVNDEDFRTIHHELGHNFYQRAYNKLPFLYQDSAHDGFHEATGDTIALSITPEYLKQIDLLAAGPGLLQGPRPADEGGARKGGLPAVRPADRPVALEGLFGRDQAGRVQLRLVGAAAEIPGRGAAGAAHRKGFRSGREVPRAGQRALHALLPRRHPAVPAPPRALPGRRAEGSAPPLLDLRQQGRRQALERHAGDGREPSLARGHESRHRRGADGRHGHGRLLRAL